MYELPQAKLLSNKLNKQRLWKSLPTIMSYLQSVTKMQKSLRDFYQTQGGRGLALGTFQ